MKNIPIFAPLLLAFTLFACNKHTETEALLLKAEQQMDEHPDSALILLQKLDTKQLTSADEKALYALLYSQALYKNYIDVTDDSLINIAVRHYDNKDDVRHKFLAHYYKGCVHYNAKDYTKAILSFSKAELLLEDLHDDYYSGLLFQNLGYLYFRYYDYPKSLSYHKQAIDCYTRANKQTHRLYELLKLANIYWNLKDWNNAYDILQKILCEAKEIKHEDIINECIGDLLMLYIDKGMYKEAMTLYQEYIHDNDSFITSETTARFITDLALLHAHYQNFEKCEYYMQEARKNTKTANDSINIYFTSSRILRIKNEYKEAYNELAKSVNIQNNKLRKVLQQPIITVQRNLLKKELELEQYKLREEKTNKYITTILISTIFIILTYLIINRMSRYYKRTLEEKLIAQEKINEAEINRLHAEAIKREENIRQFIKTVEEEAKNKESNLKIRLEQLKDELDYNRIYLENNRKYLKEAQEREKELHSIITNLLKDKERFKDTITKLKEEREKILSQIDVYKNECQKLIENIDIITEQKDEQIKYNFRLTEELVTLSLQEYKSEEYKQKSILKWAHETIANLHSRNNSYIRLEKTVNKFNNGIIQHLRDIECFPDESYYRLLCYQLAGFSINATAMLMGETSNAIYKRRGKIRDIIRNNQEINGTIHI